MKNNGKPDLITTVNEIIEKGRQNGILQLYTEDHFYNGRIITINGKALLNFGSCSYLGLELDERLKAAAIDAINRYGIQYSSSRSYVSSTLYSELEGLIKQLFNAYPVLTPTTTLGHQAVIPVIVEEGDVIFLDQQVHASVQYPAFNLRLKGNTVNIIRHNSIEELEIQILKVYDKTKKIWFMADGIYSMYGDYLPLTELQSLMERYPKLNLYIDDAHGMSWKGKNGRGFFLNEIDLSERMILGTSFAKGFGTGGGAFLFKDSLLAQKVRNCGGPLIFSGPNQIPVIAASIASAKIHLSEEIYTLQNQLKDKIIYCHNLMVKHKLPVISNPETPIKFIGLGLTRVGYNLVKRMMNAGFYSNLAIFPAVPEICTGLRFTITNHHTLQDLDELVSTLAYHFPKALYEEGRTFKDIQRAFKRVKNFEKTELYPLETSHAKHKYKVQHETTIELIPKDIWNKLLDKGTFDWDWLKLLEKVFSNNEKPEENWQFHYYIIWDDATPILSTFFTATINKDDMLARANVSYQIELKRIEDPYYLCSKTLMMGSPLTEGKHLFVDRSRNDWREVLMLLLDQIWNEQILCQANTLCFRDFDSDDFEMYNFFTDQGFIKVGLPDNNIIQKIKWTTKEDYLNTFNSRQRWYLKSNVLKYENLIRAEIITVVSEEQIDRWYELYKNVKGKGLALNTFDLPKKLFHSMISNENVEVLQISLTNGTSIKDIIGVSFNLLSNAKNYCGIIIGFDYNYLTSHAIYKQVIFQFILRAGYFKADKAFLGFTASGVKSKFGADSISQVAFVQVQDDFNLSVVNTFTESNTM